MGSTRKRLRGIGDKLAHFKKGGLALVFQNCRFLGGQYGIRAGATRRGGLGRHFYLRADILFIVCQCQTSFVLK